jgi:hypothetical protein
VLSCLVALRGAYGPHDAAPLQGHDPSASRTTLRTTGRCGPAARHKRASLERNCFPVFVNINLPCSMPKRDMRVPWWDTRMRPLVILILVVLVHSSSPASLVESVRALLTLVITAVLTAAAEELVRATALPS